MIIGFIVNVNLFIEFITIFQILRGNPFIKKKKIWFNVYYSV